LKVYYCYFLGKYVGDYAHKAPEIKNVDYHLLYNHKVDFAL